MIMKKIACSFIAVLAINFAWAQSSAPLKPEWRVTIRAVDESSQPIADAHIEIGYYVQPQPDQTEASEKISGLTDTNGIFTISHKNTGSIELGIQVTKVGYYSTTKGHEFAKFKDNDPAKWNPDLTFVLKKIGQPIPMYARRARIEVPEVNKPIGFDLVEYDWVAPYGKGKQSDFMFQAQRRFVSWQDFDASFKLTFSNTGDGLVPISVPLNQGSALRLSAIAPEDGYQSELSQNLSDTPVGGWKKDEKKDQNYYFRVRTVRDENGNIKSALYGKIHGDFSIDAINSKTVLIFFKYYLNPTSNSRNVELNLKQNLFKGLKERETVQEP